MSVSELEESQKVVQVLLPAVHAISAINSDGVDTKGFETVMFELNVGVATATGTLDVKLQESSDDGVADAYADITGAVFVQVTVANDNTVYLLRIKSRNFKRYLRTVSTIATDTVTAGIVANLGIHDDLSPVTQVQTPVTIDYL